MRTGFRYRFTLLSAIGFAMGVMIGVLVTAVTTTLSISDGTLYLCVPEFTEFVGGNPLAAFIIQAIMSGLLGTVGMGLSAVYSIEEWSLLKATVTHATAVFLMFFLTGFFLRWFSMDDIAGVIITTLIYVLMYIVIWLKNYLSYKAQIEEINRELAVWKRTVEAA